MVTLENWRVRMSEDMRLRDFRPRTQEGYMLAVSAFFTPSRSAHRANQHEHRSHIGPSRCSRTTPISEPPTPPA
jgi:hypothetical protein